MNTLRKSLYVDNVTYGTDGEDEAYKLYVLSKKVFADGEFNLQKFVTNSPILQQRIATDGKSYLLLHISMVVLWKRNRLMQVTY